MAKKAIKKGKGPQRQEYFYERVARTNARQFILDSKMSQRKVAADLGMNNYQELNNMLRGATTILNKIPDLAKVLRKSECDFFVDRSKTEPSISNEPKELRPLISMVVDVMTSEDEGTKSALTQNIRMFYEKIKEKQELLRRIETLEKALGSGDPPSSIGKAGRGT